MLDNAGGSNSSAPVGTASTNASSIFSYSGPALRIRFVRRTAKELVLFNPKLAPGLLLNALGVNPDRLKHILNRPHFALFKLLEQPAALMYDS